MTTALQYFMLIAKEQSIAHAAEQLFISPQNLSNHVKRLEQEYGTLFVRYPHFKLTMAGEALYHTLQQISILEQGLDTQLQEIREENLGCLHFGMHVIRAHIVLPRVMTTFRKKFPQVHLILHYQNMIENERMLLNGELDAFFGINTNPLPEFHIIPLEDEPIYFVASRSLLEKHGVTPVNGMISPEVLPRFSFLMSPPDSQFRPIIDSFCNRMGIVLPEQVTISDFEMQLMLSSLNLGVCFCPKTILPKMNDLNRTMPIENQLLALRLEELTAVNSLSIVMHKMAFLSRPLKGLLDAFQEEFEKGF